MARHVKGEMNHNVCHCEELATWQSTQSDCHSRWSSLAMTNGEVH